MKLEMVETNNVQRITQVMKGLEDRDEQVPGLGLIYGRTGYGKTKGITWYAVQNNTAYVRAEALWTPTWMLKDIVYELGVHPYSHVEKLFKQVQSKVVEKKKVVIIDEADYVERKSKLLNTIRDLHDHTGIPFVMVGTEELAHRLARHSQFWRRISQVEMLQPLTVEEVDGIARQLCGLTVQEAAARDILRITDGGIGDYVVLLSGIEKAAAARKETSVTKGIVELAARKLLRRAA